MPGFNDADDVMDNRDRALELAQLKEKIQKGIAQLEHVKKWLDNEFDANAVADFAKDQISRAIDHAIAELS